MHETYHIAKPMWLKWFIVTSSVIDKKLKIDKKNLEIYKKISKLKLEIYKNLENKLEMYSYFKLEIFQVFCKGRWTQY